VDSLAAILSITTVPLGAAVAALWRSHRRCEAGRLADAKERQQLAVRVARLEAGAAGRHVFQPR
jgi:hypothetical protein